MCCEVSVFCGGGLFRAMYNHSLGPVGYWDVIPQLSGICICMFNCM